MPKINKELVLLALIIAAGAFLRFYNLSWDEANSFHPDERNIAAAVSRIRFPDKLDPEFFAYGSLPIYLYRATGEALLLITNNTDWNYNWGNINLVGRFFSALFSTLTIPLVYLLGKNFFNKSVGLVSAVIFAFCVGVIQTAHFAVTESILIFSVSLLTLLSFKTLDSLNRKIYLILGLVFGFSVATKISAVSFLIIPALVFLFKIKDFKKLLIPIVGFLSLSVFVFLLLDPYIFLNYEKFIESMRYESGVVSGSLPVVYTLQFNNTMPYYYQIKSLLWQMGLIAGFSIAGMLLIFTEGIKNKNKNYLLFTIFPVFYFLYVGSWHTKFIRYLDPLLPFLAISSAFFLYILIKHFKSVGKVISLVMVGLTILWALAFFSIYTRGQTRITASNWIYENIKPGSKILAEHWDDGLPVSIEDENPGLYQIEQLAIYDEDSKSKIKYYSEELSEGDYIVINSRRLYGTLISLGDKYPVTSRYYKLLFSGKLGYEKVAQFTSYPEVLGLEINDDKSEETFQVYDHPKVLIFENKRRLDTDVLYQRLSNE